METDEFLITASGHATEPDRTWTRSRLYVAEFIADSAVRKLGYSKAQVINTYGEHLSDPLYVVEAMKENG